MQNRTAIPAMSQAELAKFLARAGGQDSAVWLVVSAQPGDGATTVTTQLGDALGLTSICLDR